MRIVQLTLNLAVAALAVPSCDTCNRSPAPLRPAVSNPPPPAVLHSASATATPPPRSLLSASPPSSPSPLEIIAAGEDVGTCNADVDRNVEVASLPTWTALWKHLAASRLPVPGEELPRRPADDSGVRDALHVGDCTRACVFTWPPYGLDIPAAYLVIMGPRSGLQLYGPAAESAGMGQCNAGPPAASVVGVAPMVHASFAVEASSSTRVCFGDGGVMVLETEETEGLQCQSACVGRSWEEIDLFVGAGGRAVRVARQGRREFGGQERIAKLVRDGNTLVLRGDGCTRRIPLEEDAGR